MNNKTQSALNIELMERNRKINYLSRCGAKEQARVISKHYVSHFMIAKQLLNIVELSDEFDNNKIINEAIKYFIKQLKQAHLSEFEIELEWNSICDI